MRSPRAADPDEQPPEFDGVDGPKVALDHFAPVADAFNQGDRTLVCSIELSTNTPLTGSEVW
jgi:hypothetical protein